MLDEVEEGLAKNMLGGFNVNDSKQLAEIQRLRMKGDDGFYHEEMMLLIDLELHKIPLRLPTAFLNVCWNIMVKCLTKLTVRNFSIRFVFFLLFSVFFLRGFF